MSQARDEAERIGDLLVRSELMSADLLIDTLNIAERMSISLGRAMDMNGYMSEGSVVQALRLQEMLERGELSMDNAVRAMEMIGRKGIDLDSALRQLQMGTRKIGKQNVENKVGELMSAAGIISPQQLNRGIYDGLNTGLPLGMVLVEKGIILPQVLEWCLDAQGLINSGAISQEQAAHGVRTARLQRTDLKTALANMGLPDNLLRREFNIGELLLTANSVTETQLLAARELAMATNKPLENVLLQCGVVSEAIISASQQLLQMVREEIFTVGQAALIVRRLCHCKTVEQMEEIFNDIQAELERRDEPLELLELIGSCRLLTPEQLAEGLMQARKAKQSMLTAMTDGNILDRQVLNAAKQCKHAIDEGAITRPQGVIALTYAHEEQVAFSDALKHFGWQHSLSALGVQQHFRS